MKKSLKILTQLVFEKPAGKSRSARFTRLLFLIFLVALGTVIAGAKSDVKIFVNQVGYFPDFEKIAVVVGDADSFKVVTANNEEVKFKGALSPSRYWALSGEYVKIADFTGFTQIGEFKILAGRGKSLPFRISDTVYSNVAKAAAKAFYFQRASIALRPKCAGKWAREFGLPDTAVIVHSSAATVERPAGTEISAPGGWFDAGDYNKYVVNAAVSSYELILLYDLFPDYFSRISLNIPESNNGIPDLLDEILWNVRWMLKMQDPSDGGVYHKLTCKKFQPYVMPAEVKAKRFVVGKSTVAALNFSAVLSHLSVVLKKYDYELESLADSCLTSAKKAWRWAVENPNVHFHNPKDISTGEYSDKTLKDNFFWAGIELYFATKDSSYLRYLDKLDKMVVDSLYWAHVANFGILTALTGSVREKEFLLKRSNIEKVFKETVETLVNQNSNSPYKISLSVFKWGSNANLLNQTVLLLSAYKIYNDVKYLKAAVTNADYVLGRNPLNICFVTGFGEHSPRNIHHRISIADGVKDPVPGFVVGGANPYYLVDIGAKNYPSLLPAKCYADVVESYSTNEVAINWNAPLAFVLFGINYFSSNYFNKSKIRYSNGTY